MHVDAHPDSPLVVWSRTVINNAAWGPFGGPFRDTMGVHRGTSREHDGRPTHKTRAGPATTTTPKPRRHQAVCSPIREPRSGTGKKTSPTAARRPLPRDAMRRHATPRPGAPPRLFKTKRSHVRARLRSPPPKRARAGSGPAGRGMAHWHPYMYSIPAAPPCPPPETAMVMHEEGERSDDGESKWAPARRCMSGRQSCSAGSASQGARKGWAMMTTVVVPRCVANSVRVSYVQGRGGRRSRLAAAVLRVWKEITTPPPPRSAP
jgi:hypothetical protein